jgi:hypothetical protein
VTGGSHAVSAGQSDTTLFRFAQFELPWALGPPDGRYLARLTGQAGAAPTHVIVFTTLGAPERRRLAARRRSRGAAPEPPPAPVVTGRATVIDAGRPLGTEEAAAAWLRGAGEPELEEALGALNRALHAFRVVSADPYLHPVARRQAIVARLGYGAGEQVADGLWAAARELTGAGQTGSVGATGRAGGIGSRRSRLLAPQARLAAVLGAREPALVCEELVLRARLDLDHDRPREAALQLIVALDAALAELSADSRAETLTDRLAELRDRREDVAGAAQSALTGSLTDTELEVVRFTVARLEAALRARALAHA